MVTEHSRNTNFGVSPMIRAGEVSHLRYSKLLHGTLDIRSIAHVLWLIGEHEGTHFKDYT